MELLDHLALTGRYVTFYTPTGMFEGKVAEVARDHIVLEVPWFNEPKVTRTLLQRRVIFAVQTTEEGGA